MQGNWQPATRKRVHRLTIIAVILTVVGTGALFVSASTATAQADVGVDGLSVSSVDETVDGNVSDVTLAADLTYQHDIPDATQRIVKLKVGPSADNLETIAYRVDREPNGNASGTATLSGSVLDHAALSAADFDPALATTKDTQVVVQTIIEVERANGETVTANATDTATLTLTDSGELTATVGGTGTLTVTTDA